MSSFTPEPQGFRARVLSRTRDWNRGSAPFFHAFGGRPLLDAPLPVSSRCGLPFHLTLDLDLADSRLSGLGITSVRRLAVLASYHLDVTGERPLMLKHEDGGNRLVVLQEPGGVRVEGVPLELPQLPVELEAFDDVLSSVEHVEDLPDRHEPIHQVGGHPVWVTRAVPAPTCPTSGAPMRFVACVDSIRRYPLADGETQLLFGDRGLLYVYWSDEESISASFIQSE